VCGGGEITILLTFNNLLNFFFGVQLLGSNSSYKTEIHPVQVVRERLLKKKYFLNQLYNVDEDPVFFVESNVWTEINTYIQDKG
jgi:hypothetical protein